jgi:hypothetical protein
MPWGSWRAALAISGTVREGWMHWEMVRTFAFFKLMFGNAGIKGTKV